MKKIIIIILITTSIFASQKQYTREIPSFMIDAKSFGLVNSKKAFFIIGSTKYGTMQKNFAFANKEDAQKYVNGRGGCVVDYETYLKMDDKKVKEYVKEHGITIVVDKNTTKKSNKNIKKTNSNSGIYSKENKAKYKF